MLSFAVYINGKPADKVDLSGAYVVGSDDVPLRAEISFKNGVIMCKKRAAGPAGLALLWDVPGVGRVLLETSRVLERKQPYLLQVELARGRLMRLTGKCEDWGLLDYDGAEDLVVQIDQARDAFVKSLQADTPADAATIADGALNQAVRASETLARFHAGVLLGRRRQASGLPRRIFGCGISLEKPAEPKRQRLAAACDYVTVPFVWRDIEPTQQTFNWKSLDAWVELLVKNRMPIRGSALLNFRDGHVPDWLFMWEHDFDTIRDLVFEHARRILQRYGQYVQVWDVISGIHAHNCLTFNFEQIMELTRMACALAKQSAPRSTAVIDLVDPWGEYYARNQRTIPPMLYAEMAVQSGVTFDAFGLQCFFGAGIDGHFARDFFQVSSVFDAFAKHGKPLHITATQAPSSTAPVRSPDGANEFAVMDGGLWREPWSERIQAEWLRQFVEVALSKPYVDSISWRRLSDVAGDYAPHGGLLTADLAPKPAYQEWIRLRTELSGPPRAVDPGSSI